MAWAKNGTPHTLGSDGDTLEITDLTAYKFNVFLAHPLKGAVAGTLSPLIQIDGNTNLDYAYRYSTNGGTDGATGGADYINPNVGVSSDFLTIVYSINIDSEEKLFIIFINAGNTAGSGTAPTRGECVGKVDTTTNTAQYTQYSYDNGGSSDFGTNTNLSAIGTD